MKSSTLKKAKLFCILFFAGTLISLAQTYTWMKGSNNASQTGLYGTLGVPSVTNTPGAREGAITWKDATGNLWLFGGIGYDVQGNYDYLNDLWKYTVSTNEWTWIAGDSLSYQNGVYGTMGVASPSNKPGSRFGAVSWTDVSGNLWMFGGLGLDAVSTDAELNDLWKYSVSTNQWTWVRGSNAAMQTAVYGTQGTPAPGNDPGGSYLGMGWTDASGNFWLFGGEGNDASNYGELNDLWKYTVSNNQWTWVKGSASAGQNGSYGTISVPAAGNLPGGRYATTGWADASGNLWLMGGLGFDASSPFSDALNDLWKYNITSNQWTWLKGSNTIGQAGAYGTLGTPSPANVPGARAGDVSWIDAAGTVYLFGGSDLSTEFNDLWSYSTATNQWTWLKGSSSPGQNGVYGTQGVAAAANTPGARIVPASWIDNSNNLWLFGGFGFSAVTSNEDDMNDLWKLSTCAAPTLTFTASQPTICAGQSSTITVSGASSYTWAGTQTTNTISVSPTITTAYFVTGINGSGCNGSASFTQVVSPAPVINVVSSFTTPCVGSSFSLVAMGANGITWSNGNTGSVTTTSYSTAGLFSITASGANAFGCPGSSPVHTVNVNPNPSVTASSTKAQSCKGETVTLTANGALSYTWNTTPATEDVSLMVSPVQTSTYSVTGTDTHGCKNTFVFTQVVSACTGLAEQLSLTQAFSIYPNPGNGKFTVRSALFQDAQLVIFNALGQKVVEVSLISEQTQAQADLPKGIYHYVLMQGNEKAGTGKLVIE